jgi:glycosyltransferase involved in cell wall biosynthesis
VTQSGHRVLIINQYAGSPRHGMEFRPYSLAREWQATGNAVRIVAGSPSHLRSLNPTLERTFSREDVDGVEFDWFRLPQYDGNGARRAANIMAFATLLRGRSRALADGFKPDIVIASSTHPLDFYGARSIARRARARLVFEIHDLWPLTPVELGRMSPNHPFVRLLSRGERDAATQSDAVISILPRADAHLVTRGMSPSRYVHVPNGISISGSDVAEPLPPAHAELIDRLRAEGRFLVGYTGGLGIANAMEDLVAAAARLGDANVAFLLWGDGPLRAQLEQQAAASGLGNVHFLGSIPRAAVRSALTACDVLYLGWKRSPIYRFGLSPNKLYDYMAASRPILHATSAPGDPVAESGGGISVEGEDSPAIADAVRRLASMPARELAEMGERGRAHVVAHHDYPGLAARFLAAAAGTVAA